MLITLRTNINNIRRAIYNKHHRTITINTRTINSQFPHKIIIQISTWAISNSNRITHKVINNPVSFKTTKLQVMDLSKFTNNRMILAIMEVIRQTLDGTFHEIKLLTL